MNYTLIIATVLLFLSPSMTGAQLNNKIPVESTVCNVVADVGFILDASTSILSSGVGEQSWNSILYFVEAAVSAFPISPSVTRVGVVHFSSTASLDFDFARYDNAADLQRAVAALKIQGGETNTADGFHVANTQLFTSRRNGVKTVCIVITDGQPNMNVKETFVRADETKALGIDVIAIGITNAVNLETLNKIASSLDYVFQVSDYASIDNIVANLTTLLCEKIVTLPDTKTITTTTPSISIGQLSSSSSRNTDVVFLLEAGDRVDDSEYTSLLGFVSNLTSTLPIGPDAMQVGVMTYGGKPNTRINFGQYTDVTSLANGIKQIQKDTGSTADLTGALYYVRDKMFTAAHGARENARRVAIVSAEDDPASPLQNGFSADFVRRAGIDVIIMVVGTEGEPGFTYDAAKQLYRFTSYPALNALSATLHDVLCAKVK